MKIKIFFELREDIWVFISHLLKPIVDPAVQDGQDVAGGGVVGPVQGVALEARRVKQHKIDEFEVRFLHKKVSNSR